MKKSVLALSAVVILFAACKKDDDKVTETKRDYLTTGKWKTTAMTQAMTFMGQTQSTDIYAGRQACDKDDLAVFLTDGNLQEDEGATKCSSGDPQTSNVGTWALINDNAKLVMTEGGNSVTYAVNELTSSSMKLSYDTTMTVQGFSTTTSMKITMAKN